MGTGIFLNGKFIECDITNLEILVKGNIQNLTIGTNNSTTIKMSHTTMNIGSIAQQNFYGNIISGGEFNSTLNNDDEENVIQTIETIPTVKITVENDVGNLTANTGNVYCKNANFVDTASGNVNISGDVSGSVKSMSGNIQVLGSVGGNASSVSGTVFTKMRKF